MITQKQKSINHLIQESWKVSWQKQNDYVTKPSPSRISSESITFQSEFNSMCGKKAFLHLNRWDRCATFENFPLLHVLIVSKGWNKLCNVILTGYLS